MIFTSVCLLSSVLNVEEVSWMDDIYILMLLANVGARRWLPRLQVWVPVLAFDVSALLLPPQHVCSLSRLSTRPTSSTRPATRSASPSAIRESLRSRQRRSRRPALHLLPSTSPKCWGLEASARVAVLHFDASRAESGGFDGCLLFLTTKEVCSSSLALFLHLYP